MASVLEQVRGPTFQWTQWTQWPHIRKLITDSVFEEVWSEAAGAVWTNTFTLIATPIWDEIWSTHCRRQLPIK